MTDTLSLESFSYHLPEDRIALYPLEKRDGSKLLVYKNEIIEDSLFSNIDAYLGAKTCFFINNTKVIKARLLFKKKTGAIIEIFCLKRVDFQANSIQQNDRKKEVWACYVGNAKKWKNEPLTIDAEINSKKIQLRAALLNRKGDTFEVEFEWKQPQYSFFDILDIFGSVPLPPYIKRKNELSDDVRYQTVYSKESGSVAAPTAGLHFTDAMINKLKKKYEFAYVTLNVGAGTFKPISTSIEEHTMHTETICLDIITIRNLRAHIGKTKILAVGTTSLRTLESLYWMGLNIYTKNANPFQIEQSMPYKAHINIDVKTSLDALINFMETENTNVLIGATSLMIMPGYKYKIVDILLTNFHQPKSTLLLLVSAFIGEAWHNIYTHALKNNYRFLSYGDACLFFRQN